MAAVVTDTSRVVLMDGGSIAPDDSLLAVSLLFRASSQIPPVIGGSGYALPMTWSDCIRDRISREWDRKWRDALSWKEYVRMLPSSTRDGTGAPEVNRLERNTSSD